MSKGVELVSKWYDGKEERFSDLSDKVAKVKGCRLVQNDKRTKNAKTQDFRFIATAPSAHVLKELEAATGLEWHFLGSAKGDDGAGLTVPGRVAAPMSRGSFREDELLGHWEKEREKLLKELKAAQEEADELSEAEQKARKGKIELQRSLETELHALQKEKKMWDVERKQMAECMQSLRDELEEVKTQFAELEAQQREEDGKRSKESAKEKKGQHAESSVGSVCARCKQLKGLSEFSVSQKRKRAGDRKCKKCAAEEDAKHNQ